MIIGQWFSHIDCAPVRVIDYSTTIEPHWLFVIISTNSSNWLFIWVVKRVQSNNSHDWLFEWLIIQQRFDNDCSINQLAWLIIRLWLSHIDYSWLINQLTTLIIHSSSQGSSINQLAWLIIRVLIIQQRFDIDCLINQLAWLIIRQWLSHIDYSWLINTLMKLMIHSGSRASSINQLAWLIIRVTDYLAKIRQ